MMMELEYCLLVLGKRNSQNPTHPKFVLFLAKSPSIYLLLYILVIREGVSY